MDDAAAEDRVLEFGASRVYIGKYSYGVLGTRIFTYDQGASLHVGRFCSVAMDVNILLGGEHRTDRFTTYPFGHQKFLAELGGEGITQPSGTKGDVVIGNDVWIGFGATILSGVTIGDGAVIAARAHVYRNVEPFEIVGGNPAKHIRYRFNAEMRDLMMRLRWWELPDESIKQISEILSCSEPTKELLDLMLQAFRGQDAIGEQRTDAA
ncbi:CatB-related O-acetyltransferase (plasmid) [Rhizobium leguminosarum bv. viciae 248]|uniref:CatB-related O-acetyltransferase n=1 Tax=Rhizobium leguminosarum TaxID=384 RepID=UPI0003753EF0|nr:CatB-related O-acetyltransferase [Rhizobium leguminosarum]MBY5553873.1 CatB-related O-acetyltransferase [Rhizobium leguminosarum]MBY5565032.1 CatB-related O-acetyltransferase [Rhizobium leguminosarum]MBY5635072.1 CatB-related O-acetyltransferase [Rhizobium leguminosarum]MBY5693502.1 CatB-related O-acetyltransferase [Rhizobium leguminosarum]MBY5714289.1 CatB-related O-acetyltransferase [Rhizobium leguminosarum]